MIKSIRFLEKLNKAYIRKRRVLIVPFEKKTLGLLYVLLNLNFVNYVYASKGNLVIILKIFNKRRIRVICNSTRVEELRATCHVNALIYDLNVAFVFVEKSKFIVRNFFIDDDKRKLLFILF